MISHRTAWSTFRASVTLYSCHNFAYQQLKRDLIRGAASRLHRRVRDCSVDSRCKWCSLLIGCFPNFARKRFIRNLEYLPNMLSTRNRHPHVCVVELISRHLEIFGDPSCPVIFNKSNMYDILACIILQQYCLVYNGRSQEADVDQTEERFVSVGSSSHAGYILFDIKVNILYKRFSLEHLQTKFELW